MTDNCDSIESDVHQSRYYFSIALDECRVLKQPDTSVELEKGDFLVFDDKNTLLSFKKDDFHLLFRHADGRGSYVYVKHLDEAVQDHEVQTALKISASNSSQDNASATIPTVPTSPLTLDGDNSSKWIQKTTILAFYLKNTVSLLKKNAPSGTGVQYQGDEGDVLLIHTCGCVEAIIPANKFQKYFTFLKTDESEPGVTVAMDDVYGGDSPSVLFSGALARLSNEHQLEVKRLYPVKAREMKESFAAFSCGDYVTYGQAGDYLVQESYAVQKRESVLTALSSSRLALSDHGIDDDCGDDFEDKGGSKDKVSRSIMEEEADNISSGRPWQWVLSSHQMHSLFIRMEDEKVDDKDDVGNTGEDFVMVSGMAEETDTSTSTVDKTSNLFLLMPTDAFLSHYKCWEGVLHKRTKITLSWKAVYAVLYPNRLVLGKYFPVKASRREGDAPVYELKDIPEDCKLPSQTIHLIYCSIHPSVVDKKDTIFLDNVQINVTPSQQEFEPHSFVIKTAASSFKRFTNFITNKASAKPKQQTDSEMISNSKGIYLYSPMLNLDVLSSLLHSAVLYSRRDKALSATQSGDAARVIQILLSVSPSDALDILHTLCPIDASPGMMIQHEAAKTSLELIKALFPLAGQSSCFPYMFHEDMDIFAYSTSGFMCLHYAVLADNIAIVKYFLQNKEFNLSASTLTRNGSTSLHLVKSREITLLLLNNDASLSITDDDGHSPLMSLIIFGGFEAVMAFLEHTNTPSNSLRDAVTFDINGKSWRTGLSALSYAIRTLNARSIEIVAGILSKGGNPNSLDLKNNSCLHEAVHLFNTLSKGFEYDEDAMRKDTVLCLELIKMLIAAGADISLQNDEGKTPFLLICHAECFQNTSEAEQIVDLVTTIKTTEHGNNSGNNDEFHTLLDSRSPDGSFPLHHIVRQSNSTLLAYVIKKGVNVNSKDINGNTPLDLLHAAQANIGPCSRLQEVEKMMQCLNILTSNKALRRLRKNIPMEVDQSTIKFVSSSSHVGLYEVKSATLRVMIDRLCSEMTYNDIDAEALVFSFKKSDRSSCDVTLDYIASNYPEISNDTTLLLDEKDVDVTIVSVNDGDGDGDDDDDDDAKKKDEEKNGENTGSGMSHDSLSAPVSQDSFIIRKSRKGSGFMDAREHSPGGLLLLLRMWFDLNPQSIDLENTLFVKILRTLAAKLLKDYPRDLSLSSRRLFAATLDDDTFDAQDLVDGFRCVLAGPIVSLRRALSSLRRNSENERKLKDLLVFFETPNWSIKAMKLMGVEGCAVFQLRKHLPLHIAQQASSMQHYLHQLIDEDEILSLKYSDPDICPNICVLRKWNDNVANCFASEILSEVTPKKRADVICHILDIAFRSLEAMNNFELLVIILGVLECTAVYRLKLTWACVEKKVPGRRKKFKDIVGIGGRNVRSLMQNVQPPLVPYLGVYMQQMINLYEMPSKYKHEDCEGEHINLSKYRNILKVLHSHTKSQVKYFDLQVNEVIQKCLQKPTAMCTEDMFLRMSAELEP